MNKKYGERMTKYGGFEQYSIAEINVHLKKEIEEWNNTNDFNEMVDIANCCAMIWSIIFDDEIREKNNRLLDLRRS